MNRDVKALNAHPLWVDDGRFRGAVEVVEIPLAQNRKTIGVRLWVGDRYVHLPRHRLEELREALKLVETEASDQYKKILKEMNHE
jgi:hypothetical protein